MNSATKYLIAIALIMPVLAMAQKSSKTRPPASVFPRVGTVFINTYYVTDSLGALVPDSIAKPGMLDDTQRVVLSGVKSHGKTNCIAMLGLHHTDTNIFSYAKNGDVWLLNTGRGGTWIRLPFGLDPGKPLTSATTLDTGTIMGKHYEQFDHDVTQVLGYDTSSVSGTVFACIKLQIVHVKVFESKPYMNAETYWFAPALGYFVRVNFGWDLQYFLNQQIRKYSES